MFRIVALVLIFLTGCVSQAELDRHIQTTDESLEHIESLRSSVDSLEYANDQQHRETEQAIALLADIQDRLERLDAYLESRPNSETLIISAPSPAQSERPQSVTVEERVVLGARERVIFDSADIAYVARVDTGAAISSLHADNIQVFERNSEDWVRFDVDHASLAEDNHRTFEAPIKRTIRIRQANADEAQRRYVVELWLRLGSIYQKTEFTLTDRNSLDNTVLLGRDFFMDIAVVDVSKEFVESNK